MTGAMKLQRIFWIGVCFLMISPSIFAATYDVDVSHSQVHFSIKHLMVFKVRGTFQNFTGQIDLDPKKGTLKSVKSTIDVQSIDTGTAKRDDHLRSPDFFSVKEFPNIYFTSQKISGSKDNLSVQGELEIHGVKKTITLKGEFLGLGADPWGNERAGFEASAVIDRRDFGLKWNKALETGGVVVGNEVKIQLEIEAVRKK